MRVACLLLILLNASNAQMPEDPLARWELADRQVVRLAPARFTALPSAIITELQRRGCTIPQVPEIAGLHNVIRSEFARPGQQDWAVLCSVNRISSVLVFWNGSASNPAVLATMKDIDRLQSWGGERIIYSRLLSPVDAKWIMEHHRGFGGPTPPPMDHLGIDDAFWGKASGVHYLYDGKWLRLQGAD